MFKKFYGFVGSLSFLPHMGEEIEDSYMDFDDAIPVGENFGFNPKKNQPDDEDDFQFLNDETEPSEDDWEEFDDTEDDFDALMRKRERREAEIFAWSVFSVGLLSFVGLSIALYRKFLKNV